MPVRGKTSLEDLIAPRSVAVIGASDNPSRIGGRPINYIKNAGFEGGIYPVNPKRDMVQGLRAYPTVSDIDGPVDCALIAVPVDLALKTAKQCVEKGVKTAVVFTSGFAEAGDDGAAKQQEFLEIARAGGMRVIGPNCLGVFNSAIGLYLTFTNTIDRGWPEPGGYAIASQSGAYGSHIYLLAYERGLGIRYWITTGNEVDVDVAESIKLLAENEDCDVIMAYAEGVKDGPALVEALDTARANRKPVIVMKVGRSDVGAAAAASHTASLAGEDRIYDAIFRQYGACRVRTTEELIDVAYACRRRIYPAGRRLGIITISGGGGVLMADAASEHGLDVAPMPEAAQAEIKAMLPYAGPRNPVDITGQFYNDTKLLERGLGLMLEQGKYDAVLSFFTSVAGSRTVSDVLRQTFKSGAEGFDDRLIAMSLIAPDDIVAQYEADGFPCFEDPSRAVAAIAALCRIGIAFDQAPVGIETMLMVGAELPPGRLGEREAKAVLAAAGVPMVEDRLVDSADAAAEAQQEFAGPVVMKIASPDIPHKTEVGGVLLDVAGEDEARQGFETLMARAKKHRPDARVDGVLVSPMVGDGVECILGVSRDPIFGPMVLFGLGGIFTEVLEDVTFRQAPFDMDEAHRMIGEIKGVKVLDGVRGRPPADREALAEALVRLSEFAAVHEDGIESVDLNPFVVREKGALALDALIVRRGGES